MLINTHGEYVIARRVRRADTFLQRLHGLMFSKTFPPSIDALILDPCNAVHTLFMRYQLDVIFLDDHMKIIHIITGMKPGRLSPVVKGARCVVEMREGSASNCGLLVGDSLYFEDGKAVY